MTEPPEPPLLLIWDAPPLDPPEPERALRAADGRPVQVVDWTSHPDAPPPDLLARATLILTAARPIDGAMIRTAQRCLAIVIYGPGERTTIDCAAARDAGIYVAATPEADADAWSRCVIDWIRRHPRARPLRRLRLGLIGLGEVGRRVARWARDGGAQPLAFDPFVDADTLASMGVAAAPLEELVGWAEALVLTASREAGEGPLLDADRLPLLAPSAWLIHAADPERVDAEALVRVLALGRPQRVVWPEPYERLALRSPRLAGHPHVAPEPALAPGACPDPRARRARAAWVAARVLAGRRPPAVWIDPPFPRLAEFVPVASDPAGAG